MIDYEKYPLLPNDYSKRISISINRIENGYLFMWEMVGANGSFFTDKPKLAFRELFERLHKYIDMRERDIKSEVDMGGMP
jgi:hypothetical protein